MGSQKPQQSSIEMQQNQKKNHPNTSGIEKNAKKKETREEIVVKSYLSPFLCCKQSIAFEPNNQGRYNAQKTATN